MTKITQHFLGSFKAFAPADQRDVLVKSLREPLKAGCAAPSDDQLLALADLVSLEYEEAETAS